MKNFVDSLKAELREGWKTGVQSTQFWRAMEKKTLRREHYGSLLREIYYYTRRSAQIQASAIPHFQTRHRDLVRPFLCHALEEESHYLLCRRDLADLGYDASQLDQSAPLPATEGYLGFIFSRINFVSPIAYLGYLFNLEYMAMGLGPAAAQMINEALGLEGRAMSFFNVHAREDVRHIEELAAIIRDSALGSEDQADVSYTAKTAAALYAGMVDSAFTNPWVTYENR